MISFSLFHAVAASLSCIGIWGMIANRRSLIHVFIAAELVLLGINLTFLTISSQRHDATGNIISLFILMIAAAEAALGLALLIAFYKQKQSLALTDLNALRDDS